MTTLRELDELDAKATQGEWLALRHSKLVGQQFIPQKRLHASRKKNKPIGKMLSRSKDGAGKANTAFIAAIVNFWRSDGRKLCEDGMKWRAQTLLGIAERRSEDLRELLKEALPFVDTNPDLHRIGGDELRERIEREIGGGNG